MPGTAARHKRRKNNRPAYLFDHTSGATNSADAHRSPFSTWPLSRTKRAMDFGIASVLVMLLAPLMVVIAVAIKLTSPGPVFFCRSRVGRYGKPFPMLKFRSMVNDCDGPRLTCKNDTRVTWIGRILRKFKLDELPQLFNVLQGQMSMVGPRPHLPEVFVLNRQQRHFLHLRPGVTGAASLQFRREEEFLVDMPWAELQKYYITSILPQKIAIELDYARTATLWTDLRLIILTALFGLIRLDRKHTDLSGGISETMSTEHRLSQPEPSKNMAA
ncbi:MAG TPA: sugar transferase [Terriglobales bacterium]|nr:sugar transferase [Terriglobales bacterium]